MQSEFAVNTYTFSDSPGNPVDDAGNPSVAMDSAGDFVIAFNTYTTDLKNYGIGAAGAIIPPEWPRGPRSPSARFVQQPSGSRRGNGLRGRFRRRLADRR